MAEIDTITRIGLIAGNGKFPLFLCQAAKEKNIKIVIIAVKDEVSVDLSKYAEKIYWTELGEGGRVIELLKKENLKYAVMAGKVTKTTIFKQAFKMDKETRNILKGVMDRKDDTLLKAVADRLNKEGIKFLDSTELLKSLLIKKGFYTKKIPNPTQTKDIDFGFKIAKTLAGLDIGQTVVVKDKAVIAVEAIEGTDEAILRAGKLAPESIVVKVSKPNQDMRFDVPVVGLNTIECMEKAKVAILAVEAEKTLALEKDLMIEKANKAGICIIAV